LSVNTGDSYLADRVYFEAWALAFVFGAVEEARAGSWTTAALCAIVSALFQFVVIKWSTWLKSHPDSRLMSTARSVTTDARWWIATAALLVCFVSLSRFVEEKQWPFSAWFDSRLSGADLTAAKAQQAAEDQKQLSAAQATARDATTAKDIAERNLEVANQQIGILQTRLTQRDTGLHTVLPPATAAAAQSSEPPTGHTISSSAIDPQRLIGKEIINVAPSYLMDLYKDKTSAQGDALSALYIGKWIGYQDLVYDDYTTASGYTVVVIRLPALRDIRMTFDSKESGVIVTYSKGDTISSLCKIDKVLSMTIFLSQCELL